MKILGAVVLLGIVLYIVYKEKPDALSGFTRYVNWNS